MNIPSKFESPKSKALAEAFIEGWRACRDADLCGGAALLAAFNHSLTNSHCIDADQQPVQFGWPNGRVHDLKLWTDHFGAVLAGTKPFELRRNDRGYQVGDVLWLREWNAKSETYTGRECEKLVTCVLDNALMLNHGIVVLGLSYLDPMMRREWLRKIVPPPGVGHAHHQEKP